MLAAFLLLLAAGLHTTSSHNLFSYFPLLILLPILLVWLVPHPWYYLVAVALTGELLSTTPPGIVTLTVLLPALIHRARGRINIDLSFSFFAILLTTTTLQSLLLMLPDLVPPLFTSSWAQLYAYLPWPQLPLVIATTAAAAYAIAILADNVLLPAGHERPKHHSRRYAR